MKRLSRAEEAEQFEALWDQYGKRVYNLAVRLTGSTKAGWLLGRATFLRARRDMAMMEGHTPTHWLYKIAVMMWFTPYWERRTLFKRWFGKKTIFRETLLATSSEADLEFLSTEHESLLMLTSSLEGPERLVAVLRLAEGLSEQDILMVTPLSESQIKKCEQLALDHVATLLQKSGIHVPADKNGRLQKVNSLLCQWDALDAPITLKAEILKQRVTQRQMEYEHVPDNYSRTGAYWTLAIVLMFLAGSWLYYISEGKKIRSDIDRRISNATGTPTSPTK